MENAFKYFLVALAAVVPYLIITPSSIGGWVLWIAVALVLVGAVQAAYMRTRS